VLGLSTDLSEPLWLLDIFPDWQYSAIPRSHSTVWYWYYRRLVQVLAEFVGSIIM
jgi:hypothetical protein